MLRDSLIPETTLNKEPHLLCKRKISNTS